MKYHQYYHNSFEDQELKYITFDTARFNVYVYFESGFHPNVVHFYSHREMEEHGKAMPVIDNLPSDRIPTKELEDIIAAYPGYDHSSQVREWLQKVDNKLHTLAIFS